MSQPSPKRQYPGSVGGRSSPHSSEAEESVLGGVLLDNDAINIALERLSAEDFYRVGHRAIFAAMATLADKREPIDVVTLSEQLRSENALEQSGGIDYLTRLAALVPSSANVGYYAKIVKEMALRRRMIQTANEIINTAYDAEGDVEEFLDISEQKILHVSEHRISQSFHRVSDVVQDSIRLVEKLYDNQEPVTGLASGFNRLDELTAGFQPADLIIIAARPSMGKTALALTLSQYAGINLGKPVAFFSLEMSKEQLVLRMLCSEAKVPNTRVRTGKLGDRDFPRLVDAASRIAEAPVFIDETPALTITEMRAKARRLNRDTPLAMVVVDYLQLMRSPAYSQSREQEISDISRSLKALAKELQLPVVALSQLNRSVEGRNDKRPIMSDLRESGAIEQDADLVMFIYRDEVYNDDTPDKGVAELLIAKQRNGPIGNVRVAYVPEYTLFAPLVERSDADDMVLGENELDESDAGLF